MHFPGDVLFCCDDKFITEEYHQCQVSAKIPPDDPVYSKQGYTCLPIDSMKTSRNYSCPLYHTTFVSKNQDLKLEKNCSYCFLIQLLGLLFFDLIYLNLLNISFLKNYNFFLIFGNCKGTSIIIIVFF